MSYLLIFSVLFFASVGMANDSSLRIENLSDFDNLGSYLQVKHLEQSHPGITHAIAKGVSVYRNPSIRQGRRNSSFQNIQRTVSNLYVGYQPSSDSLIFYCKSNHCKNHDVIASSSAKIVYLESPTTIETFFSHFRFYTDLQAITMLLPESHPELKFLYGLEIGVDGGIFIEGGQSSEASAMTFTPEAISKTFSFGFKSRIKKGISASIGITRASDNILNLNDTAVIALINIRR